MLRLNVRVPGARDRTAVVTLSDGWRVIRRDVAVAAVSPALAARRDNPAAEPLRPFGHPPFGRYSLLGLTETPAEGVREYGSHLLAFEPQAGPALEAEAFGRLVLLAFAGPRGRDARLRRTQGGLRLTPAMVEALVARVGPETELELVLRPHTARPWWMFWRRTETVLPLSSEEPRLVAAPLDEASLTTYVLQRMPPRRRRPAADGDEERDRSSGDASSRTPSSGRDAPLEPAGGTFGGGGASGGWEAGPAGTARPPGVDAAGRIVGTAAAAAVLGGAIAAQGDASAEAPAETSAAAADAAERSGASESPGSGDDRGAVDSADSGSGTQMSTSY